MIAINIVLCYYIRVDRTENERMNELTIKEQETVKRLVKLGDSLELAIKTVIAHRKDIDNSMYEFAYYS